MVRDLTSRLSDLSLDQALNAPRAALDCVWDDRECVAIPFSDFEPHDGVQRWRVAVLGLSRGGCPDRAYDVPEPYHSMSVWLPDDSGIVISGYEPCVPCGERDPVNAVLLLDGTVRRLPFETGIVVGAIPPVPPPKDD